MTPRGVRNAAVLAALLFVFVAACGGAEEARGPDQRAAQTAAAAVSPGGATIAQGETTTATVAITVTGGLKIEAIIVMRPYDGITIVDKSTKMVGNTLTRVFTIGADNTIPAGSHQLGFAPGVTGSTGELTPEITGATFTLTVTP